MSSNKGFGGVSECYAFKSRLQEYAQKVGFITPVYQTVMEGPSHEPTFKSTVIVNDVRYDSLPGFYNRKTAEQSAAEVALMEIHKSGQMTECIPTVHQTGLCKNVLQEYCQKMNFAVPSYTCKKLPSGANEYFCTVEIGGIHYIGAAAKTKKEAEIKVARTALLAIKSSSHPSETNGIANFTVLPGKRKARESEVPAEKVKPFKLNKSEFNKRKRRKKFPQNRRSEVKFGKTAGTNPREVCNSGDNNHDMLEVDKSFSLSATTELPRSQYSECEPSCKEDHPSGTCDKTRENLTFEGFSHFQYGEPNVSGHVGWIEESDCLDNIWSNVDSGCGVSQLKGNIPSLGEPDVHGQFPIRK